MPLRTTSLIIAATAVLGGALPAAAAVPRTSARYVATRGSMDRDACKRSYASAQCGVYQSQLLHAVELRAATSSRPITPHEVSKLQLDALIASAD